jgi:hypothetical protein
MKVLLTMWLYGTDYPGSKKKSKQGVWRSETDWDIFPPRKERSSNDDSPYSEHNLLGVPVPWGTDVELWDKGPIVTIFTVTWLVSQPAIKCHLTTLQVGIDRYPAMEKSLKAHGWEYLGKDWPT